jgi:hypothetical protein
MVAQTCNPSTQEAEIGRITAGGQLRQKVFKTSSQARLDKVVHTNRRIMVQAQPGIKQQPISKITNTKRAGG